MAAIIGRNLCGAESDPWRRTSRGALAVGAPLLVPIFGWVYFLYLAVRGTGAAALVLLAGGGAAGDE